MTPEFILPGAPGKLRPVMGINFISLCSQTVMLTKEIKTKRLEIMLQLTVHVFFFNPFNLSTHKIRASHSHCRPDF